MTVSESRSIPSRLAPVLEALELDQPRVVTAEGLGHLARDQGSGVDGLQIAYELRHDDRTYEFIVKELDKAKLRPLKSDRYQISSVMDLLRSAVYHDRSNPRGLALYLKEQGHSLREIGLRLAQAGHFPKRGGQWYPQTVKLLLVS